MAWFHHFHVFSYIFITEMLPLKVRNQSVEVWNFAHGAGSPPRSYQPCLQYRHHGIQGGTRWRKWYLLRVDWHWYVAEVLCHFVSLTSSSKNRNSIKKREIGLETPCEAYAQYRADHLLSCRVALSETWPTHSRHRTSCVEDLRGIEVSLKMGISQHASCNKENWWEINQ